MPNDQLTIKTYPNFVEDLKVLIDMNFGDYFGTLADQVDENEDAQAALKTLQQMMAALYAIGVSAGIDVHKYDVDKLIDNFM